MIAAILSSQITHCEAMATSEQQKDALVLLSRLNHSPTLIFTYNEAIADGVLTLSEWKRIHQVYEDESVDYFVSKDSINVIRQIEIDLNNSNFSSFLVPLFSDGKITHFEADLIIDKCKEILNKK